MPMPKQKPHKSVQSYGTPPTFIKAVEYLLGHTLYWDLAATDENSICPGHCFTESQDALQQPWNFGIRWCWLNPPFADLNKWVRKAYSESCAGAHIVMLVPASVGSNWWYRWVDGKAEVYLLNGRITFVGCIDPYPKDLALLLYRPYSRGGYSTFHWQQYLKAAH